MHTYDPFDPAVINDPYPFYARLREETPVARVERLDLWVLSRHADVVAALRDPATFSSASGMGLLLGGGPPGPMRDLMRSRQTGFGGMIGFDDLSSLRLLIASDPPDHTRLRRLANRGFTPRDIQQLEPRIRKICESMVDDLLVASVDGSADLVKHLATPLPVVVIAEMLGIPSERRNDFKRWSDATVGALSASMQPSDDAATAMAEMFMFFTEIVEERRSNPRADLISRLVANDGAEELDATEVVFLCILLLIAGNETTTNLICNGAAALFPRPHLCDRLRDDPSLAPCIVEEVLRYDAPVQGLFRSTTRAVEIGGTTIPAHAPVMVLFASANRDERQFSAPDEFDPERPRKEHLGFGAGIHLCLGAPLARMEARIACEVLLERTQRMRPVGTAKRIDSALLRGFSTMPVALEPVR
ncbi:MAG: cytochrome P450 [Gammaproteobacteria bacterium]|nr:cytochrome P450 [Gammaproteobacteria bacterium]